MKDNNTKPRQKLSRVFANNFYMVKKLAKYSPLYIISMIIEGVVWGLINSVETLYLKELFDSIDLEISFWEIGGTVFWMICMASFHLITRLLDRLYWLWWQPYLKNRIFHFIQVELFRKAAETDLSNYDDPTYYNDFIWAMNEADK